MGELVADHSFVDTGHLPINRDLVGGPLTSQTVKAEAAAANECAASPIHSKEALNVTLRWQHKIPLTRNGAETQNP
jgi:hypothetical protein